MSKQQSTREIDDLQEMVNFFRDKIARLKMNRRALLDAGKNPDDSVAGYGNGYSGLVAT